MEKIITIKSPPYFSGVGWDDKLNNWCNENLPINFASPWRDEAGISWRLFGGTSSGYEYRELKRAIEAYNSGTAYATPRIDWNRKDIKAREAKEKLTFEAEAREANNSVTKEEEKIHPFEKSGMGVGPFEFVGCISLPSQNLAGHNPSAYNKAMEMAHQEASVHDLRLGSCYHCGMGILHHCIIKDKDGKEFAVGNICVQKTGDQYLGNKTKIAARKMSAEVREINKQIKHEQWLASPSEKDPSLTNQEAMDKKQSQNIERYKIEAEKSRLRFKATFDEQMETWGFWVAAVWGTRDLEILKKKIDRSYSGFTTSITQSMMTGGEVKDRAWDICADIYAKTRGNRNTKAYKDADGEYFDKVHHLRD
jgi:hypothetical protein